MINMGLTVGAIVVGAVVAVLFWTQPLATKIKMFGLAVLLGAAMIVVRLSFGHSDGVVNSLINPPSWKLLAIVSAAAGLGVSILWSLLKPKNDTKKKK